MGTCQGKGHSGRSDLTCISCSGTGQAKHSHLTIDRYAALRECAPEEMSRDLVKIIHDFGVGQFFECPYCGTPEYTRFYMTKDFCPNENCEGIKAAIEQKRQFFAIHPFVG